MFNEKDPVAYLAQIVGYSHAGTPIRLKQKESAKSIYVKENINAFVVPATLNVVTPHILYQIGNLVHAFPILGHDDYDEEQPVADLNLQQMICRSYQIVVVVVVFVVLVLVPVLVLVSILDARY